VIADVARLLPMAHDISQGGQNEAIVALTLLEAAARELANLNLRGWAVLPPGADSDELVMAVVLASRGHVVISPVDAVAMARPGAGTGLEPPEPLSDPLTPREQEVLELLVRGLPNKHIAQRLEISESTVKYHVSSVYVKLGAASRADAVSRAARAGLVTL
jgi:DNA-binding NarL/FixJ family response regulator